MEFGAPFFNEFAETWSKQDGYRLARTLSPEIPTEQLRRVYMSQNAHEIRNTLKRGFQGNAALVGGIEHVEAQGWVEVYATYWNAAGAILAAREAGGDDSMVSIRIVMDLGIPLECSSLSIFRRDLWILLIHFTVVAVAVDESLRGLDGAVEPPPPRVPERWLRGMDHSLPLCSKQEPARLRDHGR
jgi:hypothetical protein